MELHQLCGVYDSNDEWPTTTFGPLDKYVAANDNVPVGNVLNSPLNGGLIGTAAL